LVRKYAVCYTASIAETMMQYYGLTFAYPTIAAFLLPGIKVPFFLKNPAADHEMAYDFLRSVKDIDWVAISAPGLIGALSGGSFQVIAIGRLFVNLTHTNA